MAKNNSMRRRFMLETGMFVVLCLLVIIVSISGVVTYRRLTAMQEDLKKGTEINNKIVLVKEIAAELLEMESSVRAFYFTRDSLYTKNYSESKQVVDNSVNALHLFVQNNDLPAPRYDSIRFYVNARYAVFNKWMDLERDIKVTNVLTNLPKKLQKDETDQKIEDTSIKKKKKKDETDFDFNLLENEVKKIQKSQTQQLTALNQQELLLNVQNKVVANGLRDLVAQMEKEENTALARNNARAIENTNTTNFIIALFCISSVILLASIAFTLFRYIVKTRQYHKALGDAKMEAENLAIAKQNFLANMTHEIRTPINSIIGFAEQLDKSPLDETQKEHLQIIKKSSMHLLKIVNDVLDYSKLQSGKFSLEKIVFNPAETIQDVIDILLPEVENKDIQLFFEKSPDLPASLSGDPFRLQQVLLNIVGNAIKFTSSGTISISIQHEKINPSECILKMEIKDTGIGIPAYKVNKVFEDFEQVENDMSRRFRGTGLGLSITKKLVEMQNGSIHISSTEGKGTVVNILIPYTIVSNYQQTETDTPKIDTELITNKKILVVDDEPFNRKLLRTIITQWGGKVEESHDGENALYLVNNHRYDLVLLDIRMPGITGIEVAKKMRQNKDETTIIALTASNDADKERRCLEVGMNAFLSKPFTEAKLFDVIRKTMKSESSKSQNNIEKSIGELNKLGNNDPAFTNEMLNLFIKGAEQGLQSIKEGFEKENWKLIQDMAHKIAPSCRHIGALRMLEILKTLETKAAGEIHKADIGILIEELEKESVEAISEVKKYLI